MAVVPSAISVSIAIPVTIAIPITTTVVATVIPIPVTGFKSKFKTVYMRNSSNVLE
jgi:hypothetical protein